MVIRQAIVATVLVCVAAAAHAQTPPKPADDATPPRASAPAVTPSPSAPADRVTPADRSSAATRPATEPKPGAAAERIVSTGDFNVKGEMSADALIGAKVRNDKQESIGKVEDMYVDASGAIKTIVVSVGGFLGVGAKDVAVNWTDIKYGRDGKSIMLTTDLSKDALKALPEYKYEKQQPADEQATAPAPSTTPAPAATPPARK